MKTSPRLVLIAALLAVAAGGGCSAKVEVSDESTTEKSRVAVEVGLFTDNQSKTEPALPVALEKSKTIQSAREPAPPPATPAPPSRGADDVIPVLKSVQVINIYDFDIQRHDHTHYHYKPRKRRGKPAKVRVEVVQKPERSEQCEDLMRDHQKKVAKWEKMLQR